MKLRDYVTIRITDNDVLAEPLRQAKRQGRRARDWRGMQRLERIKAIPKAKRWARKNLGTGHCNHMLIGEKVESPSSIMVPYIELKEYRPPSLGIKMPPEDPNASLPYARVLAKTQALRDKAILFAFCDSCGAECYVIASKIVREEHRQDCKGVYAPLPPEPIVKTCARCGKPESKWEVSGVTMCLSCIHKMRK